MNDLEPRQQAHALRQAIACLEAGLHLPSGPKAVALEALHEHLAAAIVPAAPVFKSLGNGWFEIGSTAGTSTVRVRLRGASLAWGVLRDPQPGQVIGDGSLKAANAARMQLARFAEWCEDVARCPALASVVRGIKVSRHGEMSQRQRVPVITH